MIFSSTLFLFLFLPLVLLAYMLVGDRGRNAVLLLSSLLFYAWGETVYVLLMLASIIINYVFGRMIDREQQRGHRGRVALICAITANLGLLAFFKYANFLVDNLNLLLEYFQFDPIHVGVVHLPIGISFFTFQAMSYVIDLYRREATVQKNPLNIALYIALFPQLIAGPIVRYHDIARQITVRVTTADDMAYGIRRFIIGLGKKILIANVLGQAADYIFSLPPDRVPATLAWLGAISYTLQIYYDFSGYSDMAIGLGRMFGFHFLENFNYPYISKSIREFWRRWHISLSTWFRDYLYFPLGGSRRSPFMTYRNLLIVFFLCGLWHGASWTFVVWGLYHGFFLVLERSRIGNSLLRVVPAVVQHGYTLLVIIIGWVIFRSESMTHAGEYIRAMLTPGTPELFNSQIFLHVNNLFFCTLLVGIIGSAPILYWCRDQASRWVVSGQPGFSVAGVAVSIAEVGLLGFILLYSIANIIGGGYNPFLYFRF